MSDLFILPCFVAGGNDLCFPVIRSGVEVAGACAFPVCVHTVLPVANLSAFILPVLRLPPVADVRPVPVLCSVNVFYICVLYLLHLLLHL